MNAPRALDRNPKQKGNRVFTVLVHKDFYKANPTRSSARRPSASGKTRPYAKAAHYTDEELLDAQISDLETDIRCADRDNMPEYAEKCRKQLAELKKKRSAGKGPVVLGGPKPGYMEGFQLKPYEPPAHATFEEIRRRIALIDDEYLVQYPQLMQDLPAWLTARADGVVSEGEIIDYLQGLLDVPEGEAGFLVGEMMEAKVLILGKDTARVFFPETGALPPFTNAIDGAGWALAQVGYEPSLAQDIIDLLDGFVKDEDDEISRSDLSDALDDWMKHRSNFVTEEPPGDQIIDALLKANVLVETPVGGDLFYDSNIAGRSDPYVITFLRKVRDKYKANGHTRYAKIMADRIIDLERKLGRANVPPPAAPKPRSTRGSVHIPKAPNYSYPAIGVEELKPGQEVYGLTDDGYPVTIVSSSLGKGDFYTVKAVRRSGEEISKRFKTGKFLGLLHEPPPPPDPEPPTHLDVPPLRIDDPNLLTILVQFEGRAWMLKQQRYPLCPKCVNANQQAWVVLQKLGPKGKGLRIEHLLDNGGRIEGSDRYGHWFVIDEEGHVLIESDTASEAARRAMLEMGISST